MKSTFWIIIIVVLVGAIGLAYVYRSQVQEVVQLPSAPTDPALQLIQRLRKIKIDRSFFEDQRFLGLVPFTPPSLDGLKKGKANPFSGTVSAAPKQQPSASKTQPALGTEPLIIP